VFIFLKKYFFIPAQITIAIVSVLVIMKTNTITNTANLLQINDAIQKRTDIVFAVDMKIKEYVLVTVKSDAPINEDQGELLDIERRVAVASLLNAYEFACSQYTKNKIDKEAFKLFYIELIRHIKTEYGSYFESRDGITPYTAIDSVHREWYGK